jgi:hypothetical protein
VDWGSASERAASEGDCWACRLLSTAVERTDKGVLAGRLVVRIVRGPSGYYDEVWVQFGGSHFFSSLNLRSGYNQIRIASEDTHETCFVLVPEHTKLWWCLLVSLEHHLSFSR